MPSVRTAVLPLAAERCVDPDAAGATGGAELRQVYDRPILHFAVAEARRAGIAHVVLVVCDHAAGAVDNAHVIAAQHGADLAPGEASVVHCPLGRGLAGALDAARPLLADRPFALLVPELLRLDAEGGLDRLVAGFAPGVAAVLGCREVAAADLARFDVVEAAGEGVTHVHHRPAPAATASRRALFGRLVAGPALLATIDATTPHLAAALDTLARQRPVRHLHLDGAFFDTRTPTELLKANVARAGTCPQGASALAAAHRDHVDAGVTTPRSTALGRRYDGLDPRALLTQLVVDDFAGGIALVSSFGADSVVLLHMIARIEPELPILFLDTGRLFEETLAYRRELAARLGLRDVRDVRPEAGALAAADADGTLHARDPDRCCALRKTEPLEAALAGFSAWITGRKRYQSALRAELPLFEEDGAGRIKVNPLVAWGRAEVAAYLDRWALPRHPLVARGYPSIGCAPCTSPVAAGEDDRAGRWRDQEKTECGIHLEGGRLVRDAGGD